MTEQDAIAKMMSEPYQSSDAEAAHVKADQILLDYLEANGAAELVAAYVAARTVMGFHYA